MSKASVIKGLIEKEISGKKISVRELARRAGVSYQTLYGIIQGSVQNPHHKTVGALARHFGVTPDQIKGKEALRREGVNPKTDIYEQLREVLGPLIMEVYPHLRPGDEPGFVYILSHDEFFKRYIQGRELKIPLDEIEDLSPEAFRKMRSLLTAFEMMAYLKKFLRRGSAEEKVEVNKDQCEQDI